MRRVRIMLADDHETVREGLRALFATVPEIEIVAEADDGDTAIEQARRTDPQLLVLDLSMPRMGGLSAIRIIKEQNPNTAIIVFTRHGDAAFVREAIAAGASAYVLKQSSFSELRRAVERVVEGERYLDAQIASEAAAASEESGVGEVSERERDVLRRTALGHSNKEIAAALSIAVKTVEVHKLRAMRKLGLRDRGDLVRYASLHGWLRDA